MDTTNILMPPLRGHNYAYYTGGIKRSIVCLSRTSGLKVENREAYED